MYFMKSVLNDDFSASDYTVCIEVVVLVVSSFLMSQDNTCKGLTKSLHRKSNEQVGYSLGNLS